MIWTAEPSRDARRSDHDDRRRHGRRLVYCAVALAIAATLAGGQGEAAAQPASTSASSSSAAAAAANGSQTPGEFLSRERRLMRIGKAWLCEDELALRAELERLPGLYAELLAQESATAQVVDRQRSSIEQHLAAARSPRDKRPPPGNAAAPRAAAASGTSSTPRYATNLDYIGDAPAVRRMLIQLTVQRHRVALSLFRLRDLSAAMLSTYAKLQADPAVTDALTTGDPAWRLGPTRNYDRELSRLTRYENAALATSTPLYRQAGRLRFAGLIDDRQSVTFTWEPQAKHLWLPASSRERLELSIPVDAPRSTLSIGRRRVSVVRHTLPYLRLGKWTFRDVPTLLLPPEAEDLGARLGPKALAGHVVTPRPERLRLEIKPTP